MGNWPWRNNYWVWCAGISTSWDQVWFLAHWQLSVSELWRKKPEGPPHWCPSIQESCWMWQTEGEICTKSLETALTFTDNPAGTNTSTMVKKTTRKWVTNSLILLCWWITKYLLTCRKLSPKGWQARCADWLTIRCKSCLCTWILENLILPATGQSYAPRSTDSPWPHQSWIKYVFLQAPGGRCTAMMISSNNI